MNKVVLMGRLTRDPELKYTNNQKSVVTFSLAVDRRFSKEETDFISIVAWEKTAEFCSKYFKKGSQIGIIGRIQTRSWQDQEGKNKYATEVIAEEVYFAGSKKDDSTHPATTNTNINASDNAFTDDDDDNDVPF